MAGSSSLSPTSWAFRANNQSFTAGVDLGRRRMESFAQQMGCSMSLPLSGRCLCGNIRYRATAAPLWQAHCHCESCRRATSAPFTSFFGIADGGWEWTGPAPATYASSEGVWRDFCPRCGVQMAYRATRFPGEIHFYAASLDDPTRYRPTAHVHTAEQLPWIHLSDGLRRK